MRLYFSSGIFWGIVFILIGILFLIKNYTNISIPIFRTIIGLLIIYWGFSIIFGGFSKHSSSDAVFSNNTVNADNGNKGYNTVFGKSIINFTDTSLTETRKVNINVVFGEGIIRINKDIPIKVNSNSVFSGIVTPDGDAASLGSSTYTNNLFDENKPYLDIDLNVVFGSAKIEEI